MPPIQGFHSHNPYTSWSPGDNAPHDQVTRQDRYVSLMPAPPGHLTYNGDAGRRANFDLHCLGSLNRDQLHRLATGSDRVASIRLQGAGIQEPELFSNVVHFHGDVSITHHAGIEASTSNSALAALFMGLSHNNLSDILTGEINDRLAKGCNDGDSLQTLGRLKKAFNRFYFDHQAHTFIPGDGLNDLRELYSANDDGPLNPATMIKLILNDIYGRTGFHKEVLVSEQSDLCRKVAFIDITSDLIHLEENQTPSRNLDVWIKSPEIPNDLHPDDETRDESPHPQNPDMLMHSKAAFEGKKLLARFTAMVEPESRIVRHLQFSFLQDRRNNRYLSGELEYDWHVRLERSFARSLTTYFTDDLATPMAVVQTMQGYDNRSPDCGHKVTNTYRRATFVDEMITEAWLGNIKNQRSDAALESLLPDYDNCPCALIVTLPEYTDQQVDLDWHKGVHLPCAGGEKIPYQLSALISREESHSLAWLVGRDRQIYCADAHGKISPSGHHTSTIVSMPFPGSEDALAAASRDHCTQEEQNTYHTTSQRIANLGKTSCLLIYRRQTED